MDFENLRNGTGYVDRDRMLISMSRLMPEQDDFFCFYMPNEGPFAQLGVTYHGVAIAPIFEIYAGNFDLYHFLGDMIEGICKQLGAKCRIKEYHGQPPNQRTDGPDWNTLQSDAPFYSHS